MTITVIAGLSIDWKEHPKVQGNTLSGSVVVTNHTGQDFDLTVVVVGVNSIGRATTLGYQHFMLSRREVQPRDSIWFVSRAGQLRGPCRCCRPSSWRPSYLSRSQADLGNIGNNSALKLRRIHLLWNRFRPQWTIDHGRRNSSADLTSQNLDGFVVTHPANLRYLCGYTGSNGLLLFLKGRGIFFTDGRYTEQAREEVAAYGWSSPKVRCCKPLRKSSAR